MKDKKLHLLGLLLLVGAILLIVSAFTPCWVTWTDYYYYNYCGSSAFSRGDSYWMIICIVLYFVMCGAYFEAHRKVRKNGYSIKYKKWFGLICISSIIAAFFLVLDIVLTAVNLSSGYAWLGYSAWIGVSCSVFTAGIAVLSGIIVMKQEWKPLPPTPPAQVVQQQQPQIIQMVQVPQADGAAPQTYQLVQAPNQSAVNPVYVNAPANSSQMFQMVHPRLSAPAPQAAPQMMYQVVPASAAQQAQQVVTTIPANSHIYEVPPATNPSVPTPILTTSRPTSPIYQVVQAPAPVVQTVQPVQPVKPSVETIQVPQIYQVAPSAPPVQPAQPNQPIYVVYPNAS